MKVTKERRQIIHKRITIRLKTDLSVIRDDRRKISSLQNINKKLVDLEYLTQQNNHSKVRGKFFSSFLN